MLILITGVSRGLGRALADWYIAHGHTVVGCARSGTEIFDLRFTYSEPHSFESLDVTEAIKVEIWSERVLGTHGVPDLLINNAAVVNEPAPLWTVPVQEFSKLIDINIKGVSNTIRAFVPHMIGRGSGLVVNISSGWGRSVSAGMAPYCASKYAIEGLTKALSEELPDPLAAVPLNPGIIDTAMLRKCWKDGAAQYPSPKDWAERAAPFILSLDRRSNGKSLSVPE